MCRECGCGSEEVRLTRYDDPAEHDHSHEHSPGAHEHSHEHEHDHQHERATPGGETTILRLEQALLGHNDALAAANRARFRERRLLALNLVSSPGAGKTTLLEATIRALAPELPICVIEGDQETTRDAERIRAAGARAVQVNTGQGCHLDAAMVERALVELDPAPGSLVLIENVGNLVCPALFDLGEAAKVVIASVTEGEDKPLKYPHMFRASSLLLLNKVDLLPYLEFDVERCLAAARSVNPDLVSLRVSATRGEGLDAWFRWLRQVHQAELQRSGT
ncbi:MAG TPA: hydrogenase accessory protein HypB [Planctomycetes bacterium]|nr:hydrogenase accessory protein HypB [Planctomycetota bacterium]